MDSYDKTKIGKLIALGGEHLVYEYEGNRVIKFSILYFFLGSHAYPKATSDYQICKKFFGKYVLDTDIVFSPDKEYLVHIQPRLEGHYLSKKDFENESIRNQFTEIMSGYDALLAEGDPIVDLIGRAGIFYRCLSNILVLNDGTLRIIDATLLDSDGFLKPIFFLIRMIGMRRQKTTLDYFRSYL